MDIMKTEPQPTDREVLARLVERVIYQNAENGFCVIRVKARGHRDLVTVVSHAAVIPPVSGSRPLATERMTAPTVSSSTLGSSKPLPQHPSKASRSILPRA
jgi:hypothetical protein